jgi:hypothetical protein
MISYKSMTAWGQSSLNRFVQHTSVKAYSDLLRLGVIGDQERDYLLLLKNNPEGLTDGEASVILGLPCSTVSARRNGIMQKYTKYIDEHQSDSTHIIVSVGTRKNKSGISALVWKVVA